MLFLDPAARHTSDRRRRVRGRRRAVRDLPEHFIRRIGITPTRVMDAVRKIYRYATSF